MIVQVSCTARSRGVVTSYRLMIPVVHIAYRSGTSLFWGVAIAIYILKSEVSSVCNIQSASVCNIQSEKLEMGLGPEVNASYRGGFNGGGSLGSIALLYLWFKLIVFCPMHAPITFHTCSNLRHIKDCYHPNIKMYTINSGY